MAGAGVGGTGVGDGTSTETDVGGRTSLRWTVVDVRATDTCAVAAPGATVCAAPGEVPAPECEVTLEDA